MTILDTNVISELMRVAPTPAVLAWTGRYAPEELFITTISMGEIWFGIELLPKSKRRESLAREAEAMFTKDFGARILSFDEQAARAFGLVFAARRLQGRPIAVADAQIAAIASTRGAVLATRNSGDFEGCGVRLINPWQS
jgi:toxin FitB